MNATIVIAALAGSIISTIVILLLFVWATRARGPETKKFNEETVDLMRARNDLDERKINRLSEIRDQLIELNERLRK